MIENENDIPSVFKEKTKINQSTTSKNTNQNTNSSTNQSIVSSNQTNKTNHQTTSTTNSSNSNSNSEIEKEIDQIKLQAEKNGDKLNLHLVNNINHIYTLKYDPTKEVLLSDFLDKNKQKNPENSGVLITKGIIFSESELSEFYERFEESLNLSYAYNLTPFDNEMKELTKLKPLKLSGVNWKTFPDVIGELTNLEELDFFPLKAIHSNRISIPSNFSNLTKLKKLNVYNKNDFPNLENLIHLEHLSIRLYTTSTDMSKLKKLKKAIIGYPNNSGIPTWISSLTYLEDFTLETTNNSAKLPENIGNLKKIRILNLHHAGLSVLPDSFKELKELERLNIPYNQFKNVPKIIYELPKLKSIRLVKNPIPQTEINELKSKTKIQVTFTP